jgi:F-type H+-transporting ATPase subunit alpha
MYISGELVEFENGVRAIALNLEEDNVGVVLWAKVPKSGKVIKQNVRQDRLY